MLNEAIGRDPSLAVDVDLSWLADAEIPELPDVDRLIAAGARRPDLEALDKDAEVLSRLSGLERSALLPEFRFTGSMGVRTIDSSELANDEFASWDAGLYFEWTLFDGKASRSRAQQYEAQRRQTEARADGARRTASREMLEAVNAYELGIASFEVATSAVGEAEEARRVAEESMRWGAATTLDVLEAERTLRLVRLQKVEALHDVLVSHAQIRFLVGMVPGEPWPDELLTENAP
jgi:outer membrane protein TolC